MQVNTKSQQTCFNCQDESLNSTIHPPLIFRSVMLIKGATYLLGENDFEKKKVISN